MSQEGPPLEHLLRRIAETPPDFLLAPRIGTAGDVHVPAVVYDTLKARGVPVPLLELAAFAGRDPKVDRGRLSIALLMCWVLADDEMWSGSTNHTAVLTLLRDDATELAANGPATRIIADPDRREELARLTLARLGLRPAGESIAQAQDRLTALSSAERARLLKASRQAEKRARAIREALAKKAAEDAADKWTRE